MTQKRVIFLGLLSVLVSCTGNTIFEKPKDLIPRDSMILLLKELYLSTSAKSLKNVNQQRRINYIPLVYERYKIDSLRFNRSNFHYISKIDMYESMLSEVLVLLRKEQVAFSEMKRVEDSILNDSLKKKRYRMNRLKKTIPPEAFLSRKKPETKKSE